MNEVPKRILSDEEMDEISRIDLEREKESQQDIKDFLTQQQAEKAAEEARMLEQVRLDRLGEESVYDEHEGSDIAIDE